MTENAKIYKNMQNSDVLFFLLTSVNVKTCTEVWDTGWGVIIPGPSQHGLVEFLVGELIAEDADDERMRCHHRPQSAIGAVHFPVSLLACLYIQ